MSEGAVFRHLVQRGVAFAVIGARAMGLRGVLRFSDDTDVLTTDRRVLAAPFWSELPAATVDIRRGDFDDPLAGVVTANGTPASRRLAGRRLAALGTRRRGRRRASRRDGGVPLVHRLRSA